MSTPKWVKYQDILGQVRSTPEGRLCVKQIASKFGLDVDSIEFNGILEMYDSTGCTIEVIQGGQAKDSAIIVTGRPATGMEETGGIPVAVLAKAGVYYDSNRIKEGYEHMYVTVNIINTAADPPRMFEAELLVDPGAQLEMLLPPRKVEQLQLEKIEEGSVRGLGGTRGTKTNISGPVKVEVCMTDPVDQDKVVQKRTARLWVTSYAEPMELQSFAGLRSSAPKPSPGQLVEGIVRLSPHKRPSDPHTDPDGILGVRGIMKLHLKVDAEHSMMFSVASDAPDLIV